MTVIYRNGNWFVYDDRDKLIGTFHNSEDAWRFVDQRTADGLEDDDRRRRIDTAFS